MVHRPTSVRDPRAKRGAGRTLKAVPQQFVAAEELEPVRELAAEMLVHVEEISVHMAGLLHEEIAELGADPGPELFEETRISCRSNVAQVLRMLSHGEPVESLVVPPEAIEYARGFVRRGIPLAVLLRTYRIGQAYFWDEWTRAMSQRIEDAEGLGDVLTATSTWVFDYVDRICDRLVEEYGVVSEQWSRSGAAVRAETTRGILRGTVQDEQDASRRLGYELRRFHVGFVVWRSPGHVLGAATALDQVALDAASALSADDPLIVGAGAAELWVWCPSFSPVETSLLERVEPEEGIGVAAGRPASGMHGFRQTHVEALAAARVAGLAGDRAEPVTTYHGVELVSLLSADLERARAFVRNELGALARTNRNAERLRETMLALLEEGMSNVRAARRLYVHQNTVAYRMGRAQELLGRTLNERRIQLTAALMLARALGPTVLEDDG